MKKNFLIYALLLCGAVCLSAQSADFLSEMLDTETVNIGQASYLCVVHAEPESDSLSYPDAMVHAMNMNLLPSSAVSAGKWNWDKKITLGRLCSMMAKTFGVKGGALFRASKGSPRYAFRQFQVDGVVSMTSDESASVSGEEMLNMYTRCVRIYGE